MDKYQQIKNFVVSGREFLRNRSEATYNAVQRQLQFLAATNDVRIFDFENTGAVEFYVTLHELLFELEPKSPLLWHGITVLQLACKNPVARSALIHTHKFTPVLTKLLGAQLIHEKKIKVLQLLQELTYGVKISWREAHLPALISTLTQWVTGNEKDVVMYSLGILVNICYKNLPSVYQLMRSVDIKQFLKSTLNLQNNICIKVQVCKLLIIMQETTSEIPESDILEFVGVSFSSLKSAFRDRDIFLMRHVIDFFCDVKLNDRYREILLKYKTYYEDVRKVLSLIEETSDPTCVAMIFEFTDSIVGLQVPELTIMYNDIITGALHWLSANLARSQALSLIRTVVIDKRREADNSRMSFYDDGMISLLDGSLSMMVSLLEDSVKAELCLDSKSLNYLGILLQLLKEMSRVEFLKMKILSALNIETVKKLFHPLYVAKIENNDNVLQRDKTVFYVQALDLVSCLASQDAQWLELFSSLLQLKQVHVVLASALLTGTETVKKEVLILIGKLSHADESMCSLARHLSDIDPLLIMSSNADSSCRAIRDGSMNFQEMAPLYSLSKENRLDDLISKLEVAVQNNKFQDISMSAVMELYEYKLAAMQHSERALQSNIEAATNFSTHLQQKVAYQSSENCRLHQLLFNNQQALEGLAEEKKTLMQSLKNTQEVAEKYHAKFLEESKSKTFIVTESGTKIEELNQKISLRDEELKAAYQNIETLKQRLDEKTEESLKLDTKLQELTNKLADSDTAISKMEDRLNRRERIIQEKRNEITQLSNNSQALSEEVYNLNLTVKTLEKRLQEKDEQMEVLQGKNSELSRTIEVISEITARKKMSC